MLWWIVRIYPYRLTWRFWKNPEHGPTSAAERNEAELDSSVKPALIKFRQPRVIMGPVTGDMSLLPAESCGRRQALIHRKPMDWGETEITDGAEYCGAPLAVSKVGQTKLYYGGARSKDRGRGPTTSVGTSERDCASEEPQNNQDGLPADPSEEAE